MQINFPVQFIVQGVPVSLQAKSARSRDAWKERVRAASSEKLPDGHFASVDPISVTIYCFPSEVMDGDIDNIIKPILDALSAQIFIDDSQVERVVAQKFNKDRLFRFDNPTAELNAAINGQKPLVYVKVTNDPMEELR